MLSNFNNCFVFIYFASIEKSDIFFYQQFRHQRYLNIRCSGPGSSVGIVTELRAGRSGIDSRCV